MTTITTYLDHATEARLRQIADETGRRFEEFAASAISQEALTYFQGRDDDPGRAAPPLKSGSARSAMEVFL